MAKLFSQKLIKSIGANKDILASIKETHFKLCQKPQSSTTGRAFAMLVSKLKDEEATILTPEEVELMVRGCTLVNNEVSDAGYLTDFMKYMAHERPLINYTQLNTEARKFLAEFAGSIKSISAQPIKRFIGKVIVTYKQNNDARDRDKAELTEILQTLTGFVPKIIDEKVEGVRVYMTCEWTPTLESLKHCLDDDIYDFADAYNGYLAAGIDIGDDVVLDSFFNALNLNGLNQVDSYSLERIINLVENTHITLTDISSKGGSHLAQYRVSGEGSINENILMYLEEYLEGISVISVKGSNILTLNVVGDTSATEAFENILDISYVKELLKDM